MTKVKEAHEANEAVVIQETVLDAIFSIDIEQDDDGQVKNTTSVDWGIINTINEINGVQDDDENDNDSDKDIYIFHICSLIERLLKFTVCEKKFSGGSLGCW